ncbi:ATP-binding protein [Demequina sp. NBRC 110056]|uniref:ATP-binding protein n=1 Tax=Demequina sp. NBRC 110056 TaxID=1570345 RepID=UPI000A02CE8A|nr:ATP-binding protein [Demequina sp. NBRC 110056]
MLQRLGIRGKILAVVAVPILVLVLAAVFITFGAAQDLSTARNAEKLVETLDTARTLESDLQDERYSSVTYVNVIQDSSSKLVQGRVATDEALATLVADLQASGADDANDLVAATYAALGVTGAEDPLFVDQRALALGPPTEEGGWVQFPAAEDVTAMQNGYTAAREALAAVRAQAPADTGGSFNTLDFRISFESDTATTLFTEPQEYIDAIESSSAAVDASIAAMLGSTEELQDNEDNAQAVSALGQGEAAIASLGEVRAGVKAGAGNVATYAGFYRTILTTIVGAADDIAVAIPQRDVVANLQAYGDLDILIENMEYEKVQFERLIRAGTFLVGESTQARNLVARTDISLEDAQASSASIAGAEPVPDYGASVGFDSGLDQVSYESVRSSILRGTDTDLVGERDSQWATQVDEELAVYDPLREARWDEVEALVAEDAQNALFRAIATGIVAILVVAGSILIALVIARRIINPLRRLTTTATAVRQELPRLVERVAMPGEQVDVSEVQITVESQDEIGTLAEAFNGVNAATLSIAAEQAALRGSISEMFVNVARRDQVLLNRQLKSIDEMERTEDDPDTLTRLFALDHLATRMRRNSESLLVLAGIDTGRRLRRPMPLSDVIRTASSEIELYERVQLELDADPSMLGHSALTAAHLFAELLENATVFSDPGTQVVVRTSEVDGNYVVEIEDSGIGMSESELVEANNRVASTAASEILGAQRLGLFVVGRIARRVGARVSIASQENKGTVATITMPPSLFAAEDHAPEAHVSSTAVDETTHAPAALVSHDAREEITDLPSRANAAPAYTPTVIEEGASLLAGRGAAAGAPAEATPAQDPNSIEALIAADAADAPAGEQTNLADLTEGTTEAGLPTRRRREAPAPADAEREQQSIVGLPARATDEQLSALEAEQAGGFMPTVSPSEVAPQSAEERASMFRGFRSRKSTEEDAAVDPEGESLGHAARRGGLDAAALAAAHQDDEPELSIPALEPDDAAPVAESSAPETASSPEGDGFGAAAGAAAAGAAAFGAAAFFGSRGADAPADEASDVTSAVSSPSVASAPEAVVLDGDNEVAPEPASAASAAPVDESYDESAEAAESDVAADDDDDLPTFRMPKLAGAGAAAAAVAATSASAPEPASTPSLENEDADEPSVTSADAYEPTLAADSGAPMVIPSLEADDEPVTDSVSAPEPASAPEPVLGGVDQVSLDEDEYAGPGVPSAPEPAFDAAPSAPEALAWEQSAPEAPSAVSPAPFAASSPEPFTAAQADDAAPAPWATSAQEPTAPEAPAYEAPAYEAEAPEAPAVETPAFEGPAAVSAPEPQAIADDPPVGFAAPAPAYGEVANPASAQPADAAPATTSPSLDDLIQSAVDEDTEQRPGFFARLFGRGNKKAAGAAVAGVAAGAAATAATRSSAPSQPSTPTFEPVAANEPAPSAPSPTLGAAPSAPSLYPSAPSAPSTTGFTPEPLPQSAPEPASAPTGFSPEPIAEPASEPVNEAPSAPVEEPQAPWLSAPTSFAPEPQAQPVAEAPAAPSAPTSFAPESQAQPVAEDFPAAESDWSPYQETAGAQPGAYTPEQLAKPEGWEAAGASALQAAEPEVATSYQPVIQPDAGGGEDMSAVFSELSSLASERPKVEKTRAGLQRRRPSNAAPVEVKPIEESVEIAPAERDADAVRNRFSSFYSGTQRAKDDVATFQRQGEPVEANES